MNRRINKTISTTTTDKGRMHVFLDEIIRDVESSSRRILTAKAKLQPNRVTYSIELKLAKRG